MYWATIINEIDSLQTVGGRWEEEQISFRVKMINFETGHWSKSEAWLRKNRVGLGAWFP